MKLSFQYLLCWLGFQFLLICAQVLPKASLSMQPESPVFTGEAVTFTCAVKYYIGWHYKWFKRNTRVELSPSERYSKSGNVFIIRGAAGEDSALYWCQGESSTGYMQSHISNAVQLIVIALPKSTLTVVPQSPVFTGETVTMTCVIESLSGWTYKWYKGLSVSPVFQSVENTFIILGLNEFHGGQYWCKGERSHRHLSTYNSNSIHLSVQALPVSRVVLQHSQSQFYIGDRVSLRCDIAEYTEWDQYNWYRNRTLLPSVTSKDVTVTLPDQPGQYKFACGGRRTSRPERSQVSSAVAVTAIAKTVKPLSSITPPSQPSNNTTGTIHNDSSVPTISVSRLPCSLLVISPYVLVSVVLGVKCHGRRRGSCRHTYRRNMA